MLHWNKESRNWLFLKGTRNWLRCPFGLRCSLWLKGQVWGERHLLFLLLPESACCSNWACRTYLRLSTHSLLGLRLLLICILGKLRVSGCCPDSDTSTDRTPLGCCPAPGGRGLPPTHWRRVDTCFSWCGWAEFHLVARGNLSSLG